MTQSEAIDIAQLKAEELNIPWSSDAIIATRGRLWPFPATWTIVARVQRDTATVTMVVKEQTREACPHRIVYGANSPTPVQPRLVLWLGSKVIVSGCLFWLFARYWMRWPIWGATVFAVPCSYLGVMLYYALRAPRRPRHEDNDTNAG